MPSHVAAGDPKVSRLPQRERQKVGPGNFARLGLEARLDESRFKVPWLQNNCRTDSRYLSSAFSQRCGKGPSSARSHLGWKHGNICRQWQSWKGRHSGVILEQ